jgi:hypothetical protein
MLLRHIYFWVSSVLHELLLKLFSRISELLLFLVVAIATDVNSCLCFRHTAANICKILFYHIYFLYQSFVEFTVSLFFYFCCILSDLLQCCAP